MNNLEFINMLINDITDAIKLRKIDAKVYEATDDTEEIESNNFALKRLEEYLKQFQKIKEELEAWFSVKDHLEYFPSDFWNGIPEDAIAMTSPIDRKEYPKIKKVIEVDNVKD